MYLRSARVRTSEGSYVSYEVYRYVGQRGEKVFFSEQVSILSYELNIIQAMKGALYSKLAFTWSTNIIAFHVPAILFAPNFQAVVISGGSLAGYLPLKAFVVCRVESWKLKPWAGLAQLDVRITN